MPGIGRFGNPGDSAREPRASPCALDAMAPPTPASTFLTPPECVSLAPGEEGGPSWKKVKSLDGTSGVYTGTVLSVVALSLVILFRERGFFQGRKGTPPLDDVWEVTPLWNRVLGSLFLLIFAIGTGALAFFLLVPNLCSFHRDQRGKKYRWEFYSFLALLFANLLAVFLVASARKSFDYRQHNSKFESPVAHYFILVVFGIVLMLMNVQFFHVIIFSEAKEDTSDPVEGAENGTSDKMEQNSTGCVDYIAEKVAKTLYFIARALCWGTAPSGVVQSTVKMADAGVSDGVVASAGCMRWACCLHAGWTMCFDGFFGWVGPSWDRFSSRVRRSESASCCCLQAIVSVGDKIAGALRNARPRLETFVRGVWDAVSEDQHPQGYRHPAWLKGAVMTAAVLTIYFGLVINALVLGAISDIYYPLRTCILEYKLVANFFLRLINFSEGSRVATSPFLAGDLVGPDATTNITTLVNDYARGLLVRLNMSLQDDHLFNCTSGERGDSSVLLAAINFVEADLQAKEAAAGVDNPDDVFFDRTPGAVAIIFDNLMDNLRWSIWVGYGCGLLVSLYTLFSVLRQYKRISLAIRSGLFRDLVLPHGMVVLDTAQARKHLKNVDGVMRSVLTDRSWQTVIKKYPISNASFFFGILVSTAVLQLLVFGWIVATIFAALGSLPTTFRILRPVFPFVVALMVMWVLNEGIANRLVAERVLVHDYGVRHELWFVLFLLIYTGVYTVLGILYAVWRLAMLSVTALVGVNRLDKNLFTILRSLDQGHNAFWATILMHHSFLDAASEGCRMTQQRWIAILRRAEQQRTPGAPPTDASDGEEWSGEGGGVERFGYGDDRRDPGVVISAQGHSSRALPLEVDESDPNVTRSILRWFGSGNQVGVGVWSPVLGHTGLEMSRSAPTSPAWSPAPSPAWSPAPSPAPSPPPSPVPPLPRLGSLNAALSPPASARSGAFTESSAVTAGGGLADSDGLGGGSFRSQTPLRLLRREGSVGNHPLLINSGRRPASSHYFVGPNDSAHGE